VIGAILLGALAAQSIQVYSEFRRVDPMGRTLSSDSGGRPREILSPAVARNGFASYRVVVTAPRRKDFHLHIGQNPDDVIDATLYKELHRRSDGKWIAERLEAVKLPYSSTIPEANDLVAERRALSFWLDLWVKPRVEPKRVRVELQLNVGDDWVIYPMEVRVTAASVPRPPELAGALASISAPADATALAAFRAGFCGSAKISGPPALTVRSLIRRNALQDVALWRTVEKQAGRAAALKALEAGEGFCSAEPAAPAPESYLKLRDFLLRTASE